MKNMFRYIILLLVCGVFGDTDEVKTVSVMEGDSVTLHTDLTDIQRGDKILWRFGEAGSPKLIVQMSGNVIKYLDFTDGRFRDRLQISDSQTGSLTIKNMRIKHSGRYEAEISTNTGTTYKRFNVTVSEAPHVTDAGTDEVKTVSVMEGDSVTLHTDVQTQRDDLILWRFGDKGVLIAKGDKEDNKSPLYDDDDGRFRDRLQLDDQTGSLTITNSRTSDSGAYQLKIISSIREPKYKIFSVSVRDAGLSPGAVAGICIFFLSVMAAAAAAGVIFYRRRMSEQKKLWDDMKPVIVKEGDPVTLPTGLTELQSDDVIEWMYEETGIAEIKKTSRVILKGGADKLKFKLRLKEYGNLTIKNVNTQVAGLYKLKIITSEGTSQSLFNVVVKVMVNEGESVPLLTGGEIQSGHRIQWISPDNIILVTGEIGDSSKTNYTRDRVEMDHKTGDLTIKDIRYTDGGEYTLKIIRDGRISDRMFSVNVFGEVKTVSVMEGESVTLHTDVTELQSDDVIEWMFGVNEIPIKGNKNNCNYIGVTEIFKDTLKLNDQTGDLTIIDITIDHTALYKLKISTSRGTSFFQFSVIVKERLRATRLGGSVTLESGVTEVQSDDQILWRFGAENTDIVKVTGTNKPVYDSSERFGGRLKVDSKTGDLTITNITTEQFGVYKVQIKSSSGYRYRKYNLTISVMVNEGESVPLLTGGEIQSGHQVQWISPDNIILVTKKIGDSSETEYTHDWRFRGRVEMNHKTGDLTIRDTRETDEGVYTLRISRDGRISYRRFNVYVIVSPKDPEPTPTLPPAPPIPCSDKDKAPKTKLKQQKSDLTIRGNESAGIRGNDSVAVGIPLLNEAEDSV